MGITLLNQHFDLRFPENVALIPDLIRKLAFEASQYPSPAGDRSSQIPEATAITVALKRTA